VILIKKKTATIFQKHVRYMARFHFRLSLYNIRYSANSYHKCSTTWSHWSV